jgi:hypothetical protein
MPFFRQAGQANTGPSGWLLNGPVPAKINYL